MNGILGENHSHPKLIEEKLRVTQKSVVFSYTLQDTFFGNICHKSRSVPRRFLDIFVHEYLKSKRAGHFFDQFFLLTSFCLSPFSKRFLTV